MKHESRIADEQRTGHASFTRKYSIGYRNCSACKAETPDPPQTVIDALCAKNSTVSTVWPGDQWTPAGWVKLDGSWLCDDCSRAVNAFLQRRAGAQVRAGEAHPDHLAGNHALLRGNVATALELAQDALLTGKPPEPFVDDHFVARGEQYRWRLPGGAPEIFASAEHARLHWFRRRIGEIITALTGKITE